MKIEHGKTYTLRNGGEVTVYTYSDGSYRGVYPWIGLFEGISHRWMRDGKFIEGEALHAKDIVAEKIAPNKVSNNILPEDSDARKDIPICTGVVDYFPAALAEVAKISKFGNDKHNPGQPLNWSRNKSLDHADCIMRHLVDRGGFAEDGTRHSAALAWRALALLQDELEREGAPVPKTPRLDGRGPAADAADEREKLAHLQREKEQAEKRLMDSLKAKGPGDVRFVEPTPNKVFDQLHREAQAEMNKFLNDLLKSVRIGVDRAKPGGDVSTAVLCKVRPDGSIEVLQFWDL